jgi:hypothetical protein
MRDDSGVHSLPGEARRGSERATVEGLSRSGRAWQRRRPLWRQLQPRVRQGPRRGLARGSGKTWGTMALTDIDALDRMRGAVCAFDRGRHCRKVRCCARFLLATGRTSIELAESVVSPMQPKFERPRRALPWEDVQRPAAIGGHLLATGVARPRAPADDEHLWLRSRRGHPAAAPGHQLERRHAQGRAAEDRRRLHAAVAAGALSASSAASLSSMPRRPG